jgi:hypothetical protein
MTKKNFFTKFFNKIELFILNLFKNCLEKFKLLSLLKIKSHILQNKRVIYIIILLISLFLSYLLIPSTFNRSEIKAELKSQLLSKFNLDFIFLEKFDYNFLPRPHFVIENSSIKKNKINISDIKKLKIYVSLNNLFSLKKIKINEVILENAKFNLNKKNSNFFLDLLENNFSKNKLKINNSNIFYQDINGEVLFINKIKKMDFFVDFQNLTKIVYSENEIFNIPYTYRLIDQRAENKIFSKINIDFFNFQIENEFEYFDNKKKGIVDFIYNRKKSKATYNIDENYFSFKLFDKIIDPNFLYESKIDLNPFYLNLNGKTEALNLLNIISSNSIILQLLKSEIFNNKNFNLKLNINANKIINYNNFINIILNSEIKEGLVDVDTTKFSWKNFVNFEILDSLVYVNNNELVLDGTLKIDVKQSNEVYKFLLTPKNYRKEVSKIELTFNYNFDQKSLSINNVKIDNKLNNKSVKFFFRNNKLQNRIYLKNKLNKFIKSYAG